MIKSLVFKLLYWHLNRMDVNRKVTFMNFGYWRDGNIIPLQPEDEENRASLQLYHHLAEMTDLHKKDVVDVGSGRGGGLSYIAKTWNITSATGIEMTRKSVDFSNSRHKYDNLNYIEGNALDIPLHDSSCDVVFNVESSHRYSSLATFLSEARRILRPGGHLLFTDFRYENEWQEVHENIMNSGLMIITEKDITRNVVDSLREDSQRRIDLVNKYAPFMLRKALINFSGAKGSATFDNFESRKYIYKTYQLQKAS